jgi:hypothetical protein
MVAVLQELVKGPERYSLASGRGRHSIRKLEYGGSARSIFHAHLLQLLLLLLFANNAPQPR